jgi:hypothetical protein
LGHGNQYFNGLLGEMLCSYSFDRKILSTCARLAGALRTVTRTDFVEFLGAEYKQIP